MNIFTFTRYSILATALAGVIRFRGVGREYRPFIYVIWLGTFNEFFSDILFRAGVRSTINTNIYSLFEGLIYLWFFRNLGVLNKPRHAVPGLAILFCLVWSFESFFLIDLKTGYTSYFNILYSFCLVILSIQTINGILFKEREIGRDASFWICIGIVVFYTYAIIVEIFWMYGISRNEYFSGMVYHILSWINLFCNLIFALAILWIQKKKAFTLQF